MTPQLLAILATGLVLLALGVWVRVGTGPARAWAHGPRNYVEERLALILAPGLGTALALASFLPVVGVGHPGYLPLIWAVNAALIPTVLLLLVPRLPHVLVPTWARHPNHTHSMRTHP